MDGYQRTIRAAVTDLLGHGFSQQRVDMWLMKIRDAAARSFIPLNMAQQESQTQLRSIFERQMGKAKRVAIPGRPGGGRFTADRLRPEMRRELDQRIAASANLIKLNREDSVAKTLRRFQGWATSVPIGGSDIESVRDVSSNIAKPLASQSYEARRVQIDQGAKLAANINQVMAEGNNAIGLIWHSRWRVPGYNYRQDHRERDENFYMLRGNWAIKNGVAKVGPSGYYDEITAVAQEPFCRCSAQFVFNLRDLPEECLTEKGRKGLGK